MSLNTVIKGGVLVVAAATAFELFRDETIGTVWAPRLFLFLTSVILVVATYATWASGEVFTAGRNNLLDYIFPALQGMAEIAIFISLAPPKSGALLTSHFSVWAVVVGLHTLVGAALVQNRLHQTVMQDYSSELQPLVQRYREWLRSDFQGALFTGLVALTVGVATASMKLAAGNFTVYLVRAGEYILPLYILAVALYVAMRAVRDLRLARDMLAAGNV